MRVCFLFCRLPLNFFEWIPFHFFLLTSRFFFFMDFSINKLILFMYKYYKDAFVINAMT